MRIINCTPHDINIIVERGTLTVPKSGIVPRVSTKAVLVDTLLHEGLAIPVQTSVMGELEGLPPEEAGTVYIVSLLCLEAGKKIGRSDLVSPDTLRDDKGNIIGCKGFNR